MSIVSTFIRSREPEDGAYRIVCAVAAPALASAIFYVDTYTDIESAIAVLYAFTMLLAAQTMTRAGVIALFVLCGVLSLSSYAMTHAADGDLQSALRLVVAIAALVVTTMLLVKTETTRLSLLSINTALKESKKRYRSIFDRTRVALWERDYSRFHTLLMGLKQQGIIDVRVYARTHPVFADRCLDLITVIASNEAGNELLGYDAAATGTLRHSITASSETFLDLLQAILDDRRVFEDKGLFARVAATTGWCFSPSTCPRSRYPSGAWSSAWSTLPSANWP